MYSASDPDLKPKQDNEAYRDSVSTISDKGKRNWIYPKKPKGRYYKWRTWFSWLLLGLLFAGPFIKINGNPILLLNVIERKFILFGVIFWPQDFYLIALGVLALVLFVVLFTSVFGRVWCGWACPQTIFMEMVFRKIEYLIEGDFNKQKKLDSQPWNSEKIFKKGLKTTIFYLVSFIIANVFLAYIIGAEELWQIIRDPINSHLVGFLVLNGFTFIFFMVFARFREQACQIVCPYGRFQSVLVDNRTIGVTYDFKRGEQRAKLSAQKKATVNDTYGDCIDCGLCVRVCPAGIDIRNGIQMECVQCTACIDACDLVMDGINKPRGLIRYTSYAGVTEGYKLNRNWRMYAYSAVLIVLTVVFFAIMITRPDTETTFLRQRGTLHTIMPNGKIANFYSYKIMNKTFKQQDFYFKVISHTNAELTYIDALKPLSPQGVLDGRILVAVAPEKLTNGSVPIKIGVFVGDNQIEELNTILMGPQ